MTPSVLVVIVTRNSMPHLDVCLTSLQAQTHGNSRVLLVDSASTDNTLDYAAAHFPSVQLLASGQNVGYRKGNRLGMANSHEDYVVVCNDDVELDPKCLASMVDVMERHPDYGLVTPKILLFDDRSKVNVAGNVMHYSGLYGARGFGDEASQHDEPREIGAVSGCCFMIRRAALDEIGGFSEDFDQYDCGWHASFEDVDLSWRAQLAGYRVAYVPAAILYHKYARKGTTPQMFGAYEWGRYLVLLRNYSTATLILLLPVILLLECLTVITATVRGRDWVGAKVGVMRWLWTNRRQLFTMRRRVQRMRRVGDDEVMARMSARINLAHLVRLRFAGSVGQRLLDAIFSVHYWFVRAAVTAIVRLPGHRPLMRGRA